MIQNKVIIWSRDNFNTLGLMRELGGFDVDVLFLIKGKAGFATKSKYCKKYIETSSTEDGFKYLIENFKDEKTKPIIITSGDEIAIYLDIHREELEDRYILPVTAQKGNLEKYTDKNTMTALANEIGFLCPKSKLIKWDSDISEVTFPCLIKPSSERAGHYNEFKFKICKNEKELKRILKYVHHDSVFILQDYINKERDLLVYGGRMHDGKTVIAGAMIRDRMSDSGSFSHGLMTAKIPKCASVDKIEKFLTKIDYYGLFSVEYGLINDRAYFFEINLRNDGTSHYFFQVGANIPLAYVYSCAGADYSKINTLVQKEAWFIDEVFDYENVLKRVVSKKQWKKDKEEATVFKYYDKEDPVPWQIVNKTRRKQMITDYILKRYRLYIVRILDKMGLKK